MSTFKPNSNPPLDSGVGLGIRYCPCFAVLYSVDSKIREVLFGFKNMAFEINHAITRIGELGWLALSSMIVISKWEDRDNYVKHVDNINQWLFDVQKTLIQPKGKRFKGEKYFQLLFAEQIKTTEGITQYINRGLRGYKGLKVINTDAEAYDQLSKIYKQLAKDLSNNQFEGIENYL